jgi:RNA polymerase sigma factor (TIGR02999 family)
VTPATTPTELLHAWRDGDRDAFDRLLPLVDQELRRLARRHMQHERPGHTLQATALVNEAYLRLADASQVDWRGRAHFFAVAARVMRHILVDHARARGNARRGGGLAKLPLAAAAEIAAPIEPDFVGLDLALRRFETLHERAARIVELRFFGGLSAQETAEALAVSIDTVKRDWRFAKLWLLRELGAAAHG